MNDSSVAAVFPIITHGNLQSRHYMTMCSYSKMGALSTSFPCTVTKCPACLEGPYAIIIFVILSCFQNDVRNFDLKISTRLYLYIFTMFLLASFSLAYWSVQEERTHLRHEVSSKTWAMALILSSALETYQELDTSKDRASYIRSVIPVDIRDQVFVNLYGPGGEHLDSPSGLFTHLHRARDRIDIENLKHSGNETTYNIRDEQYVSVMAPIRNQDGSVSGAVEVVLPMKHSQEILTGVVQRFLKFIIIIAVLLAFLVWLITRWGISHPITSLMEASKTLGKGSLRLRLEKTNVKELDELIEEFNRMAENLEQQTRETEKFHQEKIQLERNLKHTEKLAAIGQLTSGLAHEIGTPLNVIQGRAENLLGKMNVNNKEKKQLMLIIEQTERITETIQQLLSYSRKPRGVFRRVDLTRIILEAFSFSKLKLADEQISVNLELELNIKELFGDEESLKQLFVNLLLNSFHAMKNRGTIWIKTDKDDRSDQDAVLIQFEDDGPGIPPQDRSRITDPFFTTKDVGEGTGLGLYIVSNIVEEHDGTMESGDSTSGGARITISIPAFRKNGKSDVIVLNERVKGS